METISVTLGSQALGNCADEDFYYDWIHFVKENIANDYPSYKVNVASRMFVENTPDSVFAPNEEIKADVLDWLKNYGWNMFCCR